MSLREAFPLATLMARLALNSGWHMVCRFFVGMFSTPRCRVHFCTMHGSRVHRQTCKPDRTDSKGVTLLLRRGDETERGTPSVKVCQKKVLMSSCRLPEIRVIQLNSHTTLRLSIQSTCRSSAMEMLSRAYMCNLLGCTWGAKYTVAHCGSHRTCFR